MKRFFISFFVFICLCFTSSAQMNIWKNGAITQTLEYSDIDSITFTSEVIEPTQIELSLAGMSVLIYRGESINEEYEEYSAVFTNETTQEQYAVTLNSYPNDLKAPVEGTYTIVNELTGVDQATITKVIGETKVDAENGNIVISGTAADMEITMNITFADGTAEKLHYKGAVTVVENDFGGMSEPATPVTVTLNSDTAIYYFNAAEGDYLGQTQIFMLDAKQGLQVELFLFYQSEANAAASEQPTGTFKLNIAPTKTEDFAQVGDYFMYYYYTSIMDQYPAFANIAAYDAEGNNTAIFFPQTGDIVISKGEGDTYKITLNNFVTYNGSRFSASEFTAHKYIDLYAAPMKLAPKPEKKWNTYLFQNIDVLQMRQARSLIK